MPEAIARLTVACPGQRLRAHRLGIGVYRIGRGRLFADLVVDHPEVARVHAELRVHACGASVRRLARGRRLSVDGRELVDVAELRELTQLRDGAELGIGPVCLLLQHPGARLDARLRAAGEPSTIVARVSARAPKRPATAWLPALVSLALAVLLVALLLLA